MAATTASTAIRIIDAHVHLAGSSLTNPWVDGDLNTFAAKTHPARAKTVSRDGADGDLLESSLTKEYEDVAAAEFKSENQKDSCTRFFVDRFVFVECINEPPEAEARWALSMALSSESRCAAVVAHIPAFDGPGAVRKFLNELRDPSTGKLPVHLKGGRVVMLGDPMPAPDYCVSCKGFDDALSAMQESSLHWEWCCHYTALPSVARVCRAHSEMIFVLDHLGRNGGTTDDIALWRDAIAKIAECPNVYAKVGAIEEWGVMDPAPLLDIAIEMFGFSRLIWESNWFVSKACGFSVRELIGIANDACDRANATSEDKAAFFGGNALRVYRLQ